MRRTKLTQKQLNIFNGLMLSDLGISKPGKNARLTGTLKYREFAESIMANLPFDWADINEGDYFDRRTNKTYHRCMIKTRADEFLTEQYNKWYLSGKKIVPQDVSINKSVLMWWYLGDRYLRRNKSRPNYRRVELATDSFSSEEINGLVEKLKGILRSGAIYVENKEIMIARDAIYNFIGIIGVESPVKVYQYKFDFGQYVHKDYFSRSFSSRPIKFINEFRKKHRVRELVYCGKNDIKIKEM